MTDGSAWFLTSDLPSEGSKKGVRVPGTQEVQQYSPFPEYVV